MNTIAPISIPLRAVTPLWTGNAEGKTTYLRATSILGGLRTWTEALLRSLGHRVCSPQERCTHAPDQPEETCALCALFGCTGLGRAFALRVEHDEKFVSFKGGKLQLPHNNRTSTPHNNRTSTWYLKDGIEAGFVFVLRLTPLRPLGPHTGAAARDLLPLALHLMLHWGSIGAQDQYGYGLVAVDRGLEALPEVQALARDRPRDREREKDRPDLRDFFFFSGRPRDRGAARQDLPFELRYRVRTDRRLRADMAPLRHYFCGSLKGDRQGTRYNVGRIDNTLYGWGWVPRRGKQERGRDTCLDVLRDTVNALCTDWRWKEYGSPRDTCTSPRTWPEFLEDLARNPWR